MKALVFAVLLLIEPFLWAVRQKLFLPIHNYPYIFPPIEMRRVF
jgi:hypothetical protein